MAAKLKNGLEDSIVNIDLIEGAGGIFDVNVDGKLIYSKHETGEFPDEDALLAELRAG